MLSLRAGFCRSVVLLAAGCVGSGAKPTDGAGARATTRAERPPLPAVPAEPAPGAPTEPPQAAAPLPLPPPPSASAAPEEAPEDAPDAAAGAPVEPPPLPGGTTVLHIGDSFAGALGLELNALLREQGVRGVLKYEQATYIPTWASSDELPKHLDRYRPHLVIISLGANELGVPDPAVRAPTIQRLVRRLEGRPCVWVLPPLWDGARAVLLETIRANAAPCAVLDSNVIAPGLPRTGDGVHPAPEARKRWAQAVLLWLREHRVVGAPGPAFQLRD